MMRSDFTTIREKASNSEVRSIIQFVPGLLVLFRCLGLSPDTDLRITVRCDVLCRARYQ